MAKCIECAISFPSESMKRTHVQSKWHQRHIRLRDENGLKSYEDRVDEIAKSITRLIKGRDDEDVELAIQFVRNYKKKDEKEVVLLYYMYVDVKDPEELRDWTHRIAKELELKGRVHVANEGINGTLGGSEIATSLYIKAMREHKKYGKLFEKTDFKMSYVTQEQRPFKNLFVKICKEIISIGKSPSELTFKNAAKHLTPKQFHEMLITSDKNETVLIDCRNLYESAVGRFKSCVRTPTRHFTEFPDIADRMIKNWKDKTVMMYCTGGIRCERASAYLRSKGLKRVFQLQGGIARYCESIDPKESLFRGKNFVFDKRMTLERVSDHVVGTCVSCDEKWDEYNVKYTCSKCSALILLCQKCRLLLTTTKSQFSCEYCCRSRDDDDKL